MIYNLIIPDEYIIAYQLLIEANRRTGPLEKYPAASRRIQYIFAINIFSAFIFFSKRERFSSKTCRIKKIENSQITSKRTD